MERLLRQLNLSEAKQIFKLWKLFLGLLNDVQLFPKKTMIGLSYQQINQKCNGKLISSYLVQKQPFADVLQNRCS